MLISTIVRLIVEYLFAAGCNEKNTPTGAAAASFLSELNPHPSNKCYFQATPLLFMISSSGRVIVFDVAGGGGKISWLRICKRPPLSLNLG